MRGFAAGYHFIFTASPGISDFSPPPQLRAAGVGRRPKKGSFEQEVEDSISTGGPCPVKSTFTRLFSFSSPAESQPSEAGVIRKRTSAVHLRALALTPMRRMHGGRMPITGRLSRPPDPGSEEKFLISSAGKSLPMNPFHALPFRTKPLPLRPKHW